MGTMGGARGAMGVDVITSHCHMCDVLETKDSLSLKGHTKAPLLT